MADNHSEPKRGSDEFIRERVRAWVHRALYEGEGAPLAEKRPEVCEPGFPPIDTVIVLQDKTRSIKQYKLYKLPCSDAPLPSNSTSSTEKR
ncbi:hypothetical protein KSX_49190 [Ktedonospora formicarum]|uniref:Uncharacterized protein n=1 Tax=Ktedonospora formicarum TaxID=2778364 RepID=A0A8J3I374_9CHLR|nr:hypothetical protein KSX_49190 [Ktedonospora formicarum]